MRCDLAKRKNNPDLVPSSGNVLADVGVTNAEEKQTKVRLAQLESDNSESLAIANCGGRSLELDVDIAIRRNNRNHVKLRRSQ